MNDDLDAIWKKACEHVRKHVSSDTFERWFSGIHLVELCDPVAVLSVPNQIYQVWIESNYLPTLTNALGAATGQKVRLEFRVEGGPRRANGSARPKKGRDGAGRGVKPAVEPEPDRGPGIGGPDEAVPELVEAAATGRNGSRRRPAAGRSGAGRLSGGELNERYVFDSFVVGKSNEFAYAACHCVAAGPGRTYNPLFIFGNSGLGKTHLLQAIAHRIRETHKKLRVCYVTTETFTNEFIAAVGAGHLAQLRKRYRETDVLLIDDIQFLGGKERTQEEFFHTFNQLSDGSRQIVLTSDRPPSEIPNLQERLVTRFEWGLTASLQPPDIETRTAILRRKMEALSISVSNELVDYMAQHVRTNVRRLEGALIRIGSIASLTGRCPTLDEADQLLRDLVDEEESSTVTIDRIQKMVADHFDLRIADLNGKRRTAVIAHARHIAMYLARRLTNASFAQIGEAFGGRDHGTVMHACKRIVKDLKEDEAIRRILTQLELKIREMGG